MHNQLRKKKKITVHVPYKLCVLAFSVFEGPFTQKKNSPPKETGPVRL